MNGRRPFYRPLLKQPDGGHILFVCSVFQPLSRLEGSPQKEREEVSMQAVNREPSAAEGRTFGLTTLGGVAGLGAISCVVGLERDPWWQPVAGWGYSGAGHHVAAIVLWGIGVALAGICSASHAVGKPVYVVWMTGAMYLGIVMSTIMLTVLFFVLLPVFSLIRFKDPLRLKLKASGSYWEEHPLHEATLERARRPF